MMLSMYNTYYVCRPRQLDAFKCVTVHYLGLAYGSRLHLNAYAFSTRDYVQAQQARQLQDDKLQQSNNNLKSPQCPQEQPVSTVAEPVILPSKGIEPLHTKIMEYNFDWIYPRLQAPSKLWYILSQLTVTAVGLISKFVLVIMNRTVVHNKQRLIKAIAKRPKGIPLVTVSNHYSCFDDPGLWGLLPLRNLCNTNKIRWSMAAHDICFTNGRHAMFFMFGKCIPVIRGNGVYQSAIDLCIEKCALGHWVHVFPEGKVNMTKEEIRLKWGVGRIIYESPKIPIILPMWHEGMDDLLPNVEPYVFQWHKKITLNIGEPLDLDEFIIDLKNRHVPEPEARKLITDKIQDAFRMLREETLELHSRRTR